MAADQAQDALGVEFDTFMARAGITIPEERRAVILATYVDLRAQMMLLRGRYSHLDEPSNVFRLAPK